MANIIGDTACPSCREKGRDTSGNHLMIFESGNGYCNRCGYKHLASNGKIEAQPRRVKSPEEIQAQLDSVKQCPMQALASRSISEATAKKLGIRVFLSEGDGATQTAHLYPYTDFNNKLKGYNVRNLGHKSFYGIGSRTACAPFNWYNAKRIANRKVIFIVEDELSTASVVEVFDKFTTDKQWLPAIIGLATSPQGILQELGQMEVKLFLEEFDDIVFVLDCDDVGRDGYNKALGLFPDAKYVELPLKDPNDMKMAGMDQELYNLLRFNARRKQPSGSLTLSDMRERMLAPVEYGLAYPWEKMTKHTNGLLWGQVITIGSGVGLGKTLLANTLSAWFKKEHNIKSGMVMLEQPAEESGRAIAGAITGQQFNDPNVPFQRERLIEAIEEIGDDIYFYDAVRNADWDELKPVLRHWVVVEGVKIVHLDNLTTLTAHLDSATANIEINRIMAELSMMTKKYEFSCFVYSHLNPPKTGDAHEEGGAVKEVQFTGSRGAMRYSSFIWGFERNRNPALSKEEKNLSRISILKVRPIGATPGLVGLEYDSTSGLLAQREEVTLPKSPKLVHEEA